MGKLSSKLLREFNERRKFYNVLKYKNIRSIKKGFSGATSDFMANSQIGETDQNHKRYLLVQNLLSYFSEEISLRNEFTEYYDTLVEDEDELMPSYPPMSPITLSYYNYWCLFDLQFGPDNETMGSIFKDLASVFEFEESLIASIENLNNSFMGIYNHEGIEDRYVKLRDVVTDEVHVCYSTSGYLGESNEIWFVRLVPNVDPYYDHKVVLTTPYVIINYNIDNWNDFFRRQRVINGYIDTNDAYINFMKSHYNNRYWHDYVFDGYVNYESNCIYLTGMPDIKGSKPHELEM